jgi:hypothetical protein
MKHAYRLQSDFENFSTFNEIYEDVNNKFFNKYWNWKKIELENYESVKYKLLRSNKGHKNYQLDISTFGAGLIVLSENTVKSLKEILEENGQIVEIITESKRKKFYGYYVNKNIYGDEIINFEKSEWRQAEKGKLFYNVVLNNNYPKDDYIFVLKSHSVTVFVTEKFKKLVEENNLKGFCFNEYSEIKVED